LCASSALWSPHSSALLPTRRSSDLTPLHDGDRVLQRAVQVQGVDLRERTEPVGVDVHQVRAARQARVLPGNDEGGRGHLPAHPQDRKSTRLNSSHVSISYAVFCLKK